MYIKTIEINNFRIYKGENSIDILPNTDKNIIVISGKNGYGKTTLLMSLVWCLYGRQMEKVDELYKKEISDKGGYGKFITGSLNTIADQQGETKFSVSVTFTDVKIPDIECDEIKITRSYDVISGNQEELEILIDGEHNELIDDLSRNNQNGSEVFIRDFILPLEIAKFFFFDAEKIVSLAEVNSREQREALGRAYSEVLGIHKYEELKNYLLSIQDDLKKKSASKEDRKEFANIENDLEKIEIDLQEIENENLNLEEKKDEKKYESNEIQRKLISEGNLMTLEELEKLKQNEEKISSEIKSVENELKSIYDLIPFGIAGYTLQEIREQVKKERDKRQTQIIRDKYNIVVNKFINELEQNVRLRLQNMNIIPDRNIIKIYDEEIEKLIKKYFYENISENSFDDIEVIHNFTDSQINDLEGIVRNLTHSFKEKLDDINFKYKELKYKLSDIRSRIKKAEKDSEDEYIASLREKKKKLDKEINDIEQKIKDNHVKIGELNVQKQTVLRRLEELRKKIQVSEKNKDLNEIIDTEIKILKEFIIKFKEEKKKSLEEKIKSKLNLLMHKKDFVSSVDVDILLGENVDINLYTIIDGKKTKIDKGSLSMGERQMYASALLSALVEESNIEFPVFIDSPIQKFDDEHATNVIKYLYPSVSKQVILFPLLKTELTKDKYDLIKDRVSKAYLIVNEKNVSSKFVQVIPPTELFKKYNELYETSN